MSTGYLFAGIAVMALVTYLVRVLPRKNALIRPPVANIDLLVLVVSTVSPAPNRFVLDKMLAVA